MLHQELLQILLEQELEGSQAEEGNQVVAGKEETSKNQKYTWNYPLSSKNRNTEKP